MFWSVCQIICCGFHAYSFFCRLKDWNRTRRTMPMTKICQTSPPRTTPSKCPKNLTAKRTTWKRTVSKQRSTDQSINMNLIWSSICSRKHLFKILTQSRPSYPRLKVTVNRSEPVCRYVEMQTRDTPFHTHIIISYFEKLLILKIYSVEFRAETAFSISWHFDDTVFSMLWIICPGFLLSSKAVRFFVFLNELSLKFHTFLVIFREDDSCCVTASVKN